ncbi:cytochrome P450 [Mycena maculata]|uniref:Cytochrome P450 n=1 Tax=Mycena maculata TaxID=230809 RepID=A0AAD7I328_9AGAR|nr:cytochrome P450 [Mycena maculata]
MSFPPGIIYLAKLLPGVLAPPIGTCFLKWLCDTYLDLQTPRWVFVPLCLLSFPLVFTAKVQYRLYANRRAAAAHGAILPPTVPSTIGGIDMVLSAMRNKGTVYPGEPLMLLAKKMGHIYSARVFFEDRFFVTEPEYIKIMLATQFNNFEKGEDSREIFGTLLGLGVFAADGELWKFHRAMTRPFFKRDRVSDFDLFDRHSNHAIAQIKKRIGEVHPFDFQDLISRFAMDSSGEFLFGHDAQTLSAGLPYPFYVPQTASALGSEHMSTKFAAALNRAQLVSAGRGPFGGAWPLFEFWEDQIKGPMGVVREFLNPILADALEKKRASGVDKVMDVKGGAVADREVQEGETLVEHLLNYTEDRTMLRDEILNISVAGRDTTACLLTFVIYMLTGHPDVFAKLRAEIMSTVGSSRAPTPEDFREMKYLRAVLNETLRLYPPVPVNMRSTTSPVILPSTTGGKPFYLPAHSKVPFSVLVMHRRTDLWGPDAAEWDPERFIDERLQKYLTPNPFIFLPFNAGPRICLGQQFAYHEASFFLVRFLQSFSGLSLAPDAQPPAARVPASWAEPDELGWKGRERLAVKNHLTMYIDGGLWINAEEAGTGEMEMEGN